MPSKKDTNKQNELWRKGRLYEGEDCLMLRWEEGKSVMGIVYHLKKDIYLIIRDEKVCNVKDLSPEQKSSHDDALDYLISIAHDRPFHVLMC